MLNPHKLLIEPFVQELKNAYSHAYGLADPQFNSIIEWMGYLALENITNCDALYHNVEHTIMVSLVGQEILRGKHLFEGGVTPRDWLHFMMALLCHDIGYVRGICRDDRDGDYATGVDGKTVKIPPGGTDAVLAPYHVDRSKLFIAERFGGKLLVETDAQLVMSYIEMTRFPIPDDEVHKDTKGYGGLVRAADLIGQLGDPGYLRKIPALFYEFEEMGTNTIIGYKNPQDMRKNYAKFYWNVVSPFIQDGLRFLRITHEGKQWISNLHSHVFDVEHNQLKKGDR
ncbi:MAG: metal-dependent phosphohydrolase [Desulfobacteraceae bacterium 4572_88]|nr:MAG: metal-dependent phosphohydrolase [Desulfobacteraceae bacterium 4572_88]